MWNPRPSDKNILPPCGEGGARSAPDGGLLKASVMTDTYPRPLAFAKPRLRFGGARSGGPSPQGGGMRHPHG